MVNLQPFLPFLIATQTPIIPIMPVRKYYGVSHRYSIYLRLAPYW